MSIGLPGGSRPVQVQPIHAGYRQLRCCAVCQAPLRGAVGLDSGAYPTCHAVACRMVVSRRAEMSDAGFQHYLHLQVRQRQQQAAHVAAGAVRALTEARENAAAWALLRARLPPPTPHGLTLQLLLPSGPRRGLRLTVDRRERYRTHLLRVAQAAAAAPAGPCGEQEPAGTAAASSLPGQLCAQCGGGCCTRGGDHAYLSVPTLRRFMDANPRMSADEVVAAYLDRVAHKTRSDSCINHTARGCSLPRDMRSDTCNRFACESLASLLAAQRGEHPVQVVLVVRRTQDQWRRATPGLDNAVNGGAVLRESGVRRVSARFLRASAPAA